MSNEHTYAHREKVYIGGNIFPDIQVGMQKVNLTPTVEMVNGEKVLKPNAPLYIYDTGGPYTDEHLTTDPRKGIERIRQSWIEKRKAEGKPIGQMACARAGIITPEMEYVAIREKRLPKVVPYSQPTSAIPKVSP